MQNLPKQNLRLFSLSPGLLTIVAFFAAGICWAETHTYDPQFHLYAILLLIGCIFIAYKRQLHNFILYSFLGLLFFILGLQHFQMHISTPEASNHIYNIITNKQLVSLEGILKKHPSVISLPSGEETRLLMQVKSLHYPIADSRKKLISTAKVSGLVLLTLKGLLPDDLEPGDRFLARTKASRVTTFSTPGSFNYKRYLANQSIMVKGMIQSPLDILKVQTIAHTDLGSRLASWQYIPERIRHTIALFIDQTLPQPSRGLYKAILIGDRSDISPAVLENFTAAGCMHILAISGMHMGLIALIVIGSLNWLLKRSTWLILHIPILKVAVGLALIPLLFYALIAGFNIPVIRSLLMTTILILAILFDRPKNILSHIILAALIILLWKPTAIFTASFQLSFSAVIAIALIYPITHHFLFHSVFSGSQASTENASTRKSSQNGSIDTIPATFLKWFFAGIALSTAAILGTMPLLLFHFNRISAIAPITNLLVEPLICFWSLMIGLVACLFIPIAPFLAKILLIAGSFGLAFSDRICAFFSTLPFATFWLPTPSILEIALFYILLLSSVLMLQLKMARKRFTLVVVFFFLLSLAAIPALSTFANQDSESTTVSILDVGHGSSILLQLQDNKSILIDGGGAGGERFNIGERVIGPFLWNQKIDKLDAVVISHPHADHYNGLPFILKRFRPEVLWINGRHGNDREYRHLLDLAGQLKIETKIAKVNEIIFTDGNTDLLCLHCGFPTKETPASLVDENRANPNDLSLVLKLETFNKSFLFPADISSPLADFLVSENNNIKADVLLAPHHGSRSSMSQDFIRAVAPHFVVISAGRNNPFNFPDKSFFDLQQKGIEVLTTGRDGTVTFKIDAGEMTVSRYQVN